jgi:hypothetical protein
MIHDIPKPIISPQFTIEDIHKIREWNYERLKDATVTERLEEIRRQAEHGIRTIEKLKAAREATNA